MNFSSPVPATHFSPRASKADAEMMSSARIRSRRLSSTRCSILNIMTRGGGSGGGSLKKGTTSRGVDEIDLDKSYRGLPSGDPNNSLSSCHSPSKIVDREPILKSVELLPQRRCRGSLRGERTSLRATPSVLGLDNSRGSHMTASTLALDDSLNSLRTMSRGGGNLSSSLSSMCAAAAAATAMANDETSKVKGVTFGTVEVREYPRVLGCNPAVTSGPPLTVGWEYCLPPVAVVGVDTYEFNKPPRREKCQMLVPRYVREEWLMKAGYSRGVINEVIQEVEVIKESRRKNCLGANARRIETIRDVLRLRNKRER
mmetsp:Transcript_60228/g.178471  ORF Transcript_60228/g.178471 Transcript_60228/m.178471 type:complete len:314 (-) Transcript_60228:120-1061(-)